MTTQNREMLRQELVSGWEEYPHGGGGGGRGWGFVEGKLGRRITSEMSINKIINKNFLKKKIWNSFNVFLQANINLISIPHQD
jgi:hypothetical protein